MSESDAINRKIAELRGTIINIDGEVVRRWPGTPAQVWPDYLEWQHAGKLLEEMALNDEHRFIEVQMIPHPIASNAWCSGVRVDARGDTLPDAIRRAWLSWKEGA